MSTVYAARRARLLAQFGEGIIIIPTAPEVIRSRDTHFPYRPDSYFSYLTGFCEPDAVLVLLGGAKPQSWLFCRPRDAEREQWDGYRYGPQRAANAFNLDAAFTLDALDEQLIKQLGNTPKVGFPLGANATWDTRLTTWLNTVRRQARNGEQAPDCVLDIRDLLDEMRLFKDEQELHHLRQAAAINVRAHCRAMQMVRPNWYEYQLEAELLHEYYRHGSRFPAYSSIVAGGKHACILHYVENNARLRAGDLVLVDAGCEWHGYASDITRTYPINGRFSGAQRDLYQVVFAAQEAALASIVPNAPWDAPHQAAVRVLTQGLLDLGLLVGRLEDVLAQGDYRRFYMHRTGHWLGMDVHDVGRYKLGDAWRPLQAKMVFTVEPALYIPAADDIPAAFWHTGIRLEDNVVVTEQGYENLTAGAPRSIADIEAWMAQGTKA